MILRRSAWLLLLVTEAGLVLAFALAYREHRGALIDDAFISCRYAARWAEGHGLTFNDGEHVEGFSNPLWTLGLGVLARMGVVPHRAAPSLGLLSLLLLPPVLHLLASRRGLEGEARLLLLGGVLLDAGLWVWAGSGLETVSVALLVVAWLGGAGRLQGGGWRQGLLLGLLSSALALSRPEGFLFGLWGFVWLTWIAWVGAPVLRGFGLGLVPATAYLVFRVIAFGRLVPNTFFAKLEPSVTPVGHGLLEVGLWMLAHAPLLVLWGVAPRRGRGPAREAPLWPLLGGWLGLLAGFVVVAGGDWMGDARYLAPAVPLLGLLVAERWRAGALSPGVRAGLFGALVLQALLGVVRRDTLPTYTREGAMVGAWLAEVAAPTDRVAVTAAGAIPYFSRRPTIDVLGITDGAVSATSPRHAGGWAPGHHRYDLDRVLRQAPEWIVWDFGVRVNEERRRRLDAGRDGSELDYRQALLVRPDFRAAYRVEHAAPRSTQDVYTVFRRAAP